MINYGYKLKNNESEKSWLKKLQAQLQKTSPGKGQHGHVKYVFKSWDYGCRIDATAGTEAHYDIVSIAIVAANYTFYGDIAGLKVEASDIHNRSISKMGRRFKVNENGSTNLKGIHECILKRLDLIRESVKMAKEKRQRKIIRARNVQHSLEKAGVASSFYSDNKHLSIKTGNQKLSAEIATDGEGPMLRIQIDDVYVKLEEVPAFLEAYNTLLASFGEED